MELGKKSKPELVAQVLALQKQITTLKAQANIADRIMLERESYRNALPELCSRCGIDNAQSTLVDTCRNCDDFSSVSAMVDVWANEEKEDWRGLCKLIPPISLPEGYFIKIMMPFGGVAARALVGSKKNPSRLVSIYFDPFDRLGYCGRPYWEIYPSINGYPERFYAGEEADMVRALVKIIESDIPTLKSSEEHLEPT